MRLCDVVRLRLNRLAAKRWIWWAKRKRFKLTPERKLRLHWTEFVGKTVPQPATGNARSPTVKSRVGRMMRPLVKDERRSRRNGTSWNNSGEVDREVARSRESWRQRNIRVASLNLMRSATRSYWRLARVVLMCAELGRPVMFLAAPLTSFILICYHFRLQAAIFYFSLSLTHSSV